MPTPSNVTFRITRHAVKEVDIVEVMVDGMVCAAIYPGEAATFRVISAHFERVDMLDGEKSSTPPIPEARFKLNPQPFEIINGRLVKHTRQ